MNEHPRTPEWPYVEVEAPETAADAIGSSLIDAGSTGIEQRDDGDGRVRLVAYFAESPDLMAVAEAIVSTPGVDPDAARRAAATVTSGATPDDDWLRIWKRGFEPTPIGRRLLVFPSWKREEAAEYVDRIAIEVDPGMAFGTGTHETTRLCLEWLDEHWLGDSLLDVGTGTGILAIAAALLVPEALVVGVDVDPVAVTVAEENAAVNDVASRIDFDTCGPEGVTGRFDVVVANLTADVILALRDELCACVRDDGTLLLSGVLVEQAADVVREMSAADMRVVERRDAGEWTALALERS